MDNGGWYDNDWTALHSFVCGPSSSRAAELGFAGALSSSTPDTIAKNMPAERTSSPARA